MKLPEIFQKWPYKTVSTSKWLNSNGISRQLVAKYCQSGWLEKVDHGCYKRPGDEVTWEGAMYAIQTQLALKIHPSGYTALDLQGYRHHVTVQAKPNVSLIGSPRTVLPRWFIKGDWQAEIRYKTSSLIPPDQALLPYDTGSFKINLSTPERAMLEILDDVNSDHTFEDASNILVGLLNLKTEKLLELLNKCQSNKVKRLFLFLSKFHNLRISGEIQKQNINIGKGIIQIVPHGKHIKEFGITVPSSFAEEENPY